MRNSSPFLPLAAALLIAGAPPMAAQAPSTIDPAALDAAITHQPDDARATVSRALTSDRAIAAAANLGLDAAQVEARIAALDDAAAERLAGRILAGGDTITISVTALIIILLLLILITD